MKKNITIFLTLMIIGSFLFSACSSAPAAPAENPPAEEEVSEAADSGEVAEVEEEAVEEAPVAQEQDETQGELAKGPNGETAVRAQDITLTDDEIAKIKEGGYKAALLWAGAGEWYNALTVGATEEFEKLGIEIVATSDAQFDPAKQATDIETALALQPDIILSLPVDPVSGTRAYQPAVDEGVIIVFADNGVEEYKAGEQYVGIVTGDHYGMGRAAAELMNDALGGEGEIGFIFHDADFFVTNNRDGEFKRTIESRYPNINIVAEIGFTEEAGTEEIASAMITQHPEIKGIYVAWDVAAEGVIAALRAAGRDDIKVVTHDLGATNDLDMALDGNMYGKVADLPVDIGRTMAKMAAYGLLDKEAPSFVVVSMVKMTKDNIVEAWQDSLNRQPPENVMEALGK